MKKEQYFDHLNLRLPVTEIAKFKALAAARGVTSAQLFLLIFGEYEKKLSPELRKALDAVSAEIAKQPDKGR